MVVSKRVRYTTDMPISYVIIPTYNERENIAQLLPAIFQLNLPDLWVLVVDDNSPDGTGQTVEQLRRQYPRLAVLHRPAKQGLGPAYVAGFRYALQHGAEYLVQMDADFSHDPSYIPQLLDACQQSDLVLGSRYMPGGGVRNWNWARRLISRLGNFYARLVLGVRLHDLTGGFKCYRRATLEKLKLDRVSSVGYNFQVETTYRALRDGARVQELPIIFTERTAGKSKFDFKIILESFWKVLLLRLRSHA